MPDTATVDRPEQMTTKRNDAPAKIDVEVLADCRVAAAYKGMSLAEYLSETLRPIAAKDIEEAHSRRAKPSGRKSRSAE